MNFINTYMRDLPQEYKTIKHLFIKIPSLETEDLKKYLNNLQIEFEQWDSTGFSFVDLKTLYISSEQSDSSTLEIIALALDSILKTITFATDYEFTIEVSAMAVSKNNLLSLENLGVNRLVFDYCEINLDSEMKLLDLCNRARSVGFNNLSIDYFYNRNLEQSSKAIENELREILAAGIKHVYIEDEQAEQDFNEISIKKERDQYHFIRSFLLENNFQQFELLAFAAADKYNSKHNLAYWEGKDYLGTGTGAASKLANIRFINQLSVSDYISSFKTDEVYSLAERMSKADLDFDYFLLAINKLSGFNKIDFYKYTGKEMPEFYFVKLEELRKAELLQKVDESWVLTVKGLDKINSILSNLIC